MESASPATKLIPFLLGMLLFLAPVMLSAARYETVPLDDSVYMFMQNLNLRGIILDLPTEKPYLKTDVVRLLNQAYARRGRLTPKEMEFLKKYIDEFGAPTKREKGDLGYAESKENKDINFAFSMGFNYESRTNANHMAGYELQMDWLLDFKGDLGPNISYKLGTGISFDHLSSNFLYRSRYVNDSFQIFGSYDDVVYSNGDGRGNSLSYMHSSYVMYGSHVPYDQGGYMSSTYHVNVFTSDAPTEYPTGFGYGLSMGYIINTEVNMEFFDGVEQVRFDMVPREWGIGDGSLLLSSTARPFIGMESQTRPARWFTYSYLVGNLSSFEFQKDDHSYTLPSEVSTTELDDSGNPTGPGTGNTNPVKSIQDDKTTYNSSYFKMFTLQNLEFHPTPGMILGVQTGVIWGSRMDLGYFLPSAIPLVFKQSISGDMDNLLLSIDWSYVIPYTGLRVYFSGMVQEMDVQDITTLFSFVRNQFAVQTGIDYAIPKIPATVTFQYVKIEPFVYSHYSQQMTSGTIPVDTTYTNDGMNLGYKNPPNSDEFLLKYKMNLTDNLSFIVDYRLIRHGTNQVKYEYYGYDSSGAKHTYGSEDEAVDAVNNGDIESVQGKEMVAAIYGDTQIPIDYNQVGRDGQGNYPLKSFLHDGIYDWNNIVELQATYSFDDLPIKLTGGYSFSHTFFQTNGFLATYPGNVINNILWFRVQIIPHV